MQRTKPKNHLSYVSSSEIIQSNSEKDFKNLFIEINANLEKVKNIQVTNMQITAEYGIFNKKSTGNLYWEDHKYRIQAHPLDLGANDQYFWYDNGYKLFYAKTKDPVDLKDYLHPQWILECLNVVKIDINNCEFGTLNKFYIIFKKSFQDTTTVILINPEQKNICGKYLYNKNGFLVASVEYEYKDKDIVKLVWMSKNLNMTWDLSKMKKNSDISQKVWIMSDKKRIYMMD